MSALYSVCCSSQHDRDVKNFNEKSLKKEQNNHILNMQVIKK